MDGWIDWFRSMGIGGLVIMLTMLIPIVGILVGGISSIVKMRQRHVERMAMIRRGIHPDAYSEDDKKNKDVA